MIYSVPEKIRGTLDLDLLVYIDGLSHVGLIASHLITKILVQNQGSHEALSASVRSYFGTWEKASTADTEIKPKNYFRQLVVL